MSLRCRTTRHKRLYNPNLRTLSCSRLAECLVERQEKITQKNKYSGQHSLRGVQATQNHQFLPNQPHLPLRVSPFFLCTVCAAQGLPSLRISTPPHATCNSLLPLVLLEATADTWFSTMTILSAKKEPRKRLKHSCSESTHSCVGSS